MTKHRYSEGWGTGFRDAIKDIIIRANAHSEGGEMNPLPNDISRCHGKGCDKRESCARYRTIEIDPPTQWRGYNERLCLDDYEFHKEIRE